MRPEAPRGGIADGAPAGLPPFGVAAALFAKAPVPGRVKTRLVPPLSPEEAARVAGALLAATMDSLVAALPARWTLFLDGEPDADLGSLASARGLRIRPQVPGDLGVRLSAAFRMLRSEGAARVVAIGADGPTLPPALLREAVEALAECDVVLGPTEDGGYYLVGLASSREEIFRGIPWGTDAVLSATLERAAEAGLSVRLLPSWYDVDSVEDLRRLLEEVRGQPAPPGLRALVAALEGRI